MSSGSNVASRADRRTFLKTVAVAGGAAGLSGCLTGGGGGGPVQIGMAFPYTGVYSASATAQRDGVELAVQEINDDGGINGRDVETVDRDTELAADVNTRRVQDLLEEVEVDLLVANLSGGLSIQTQQAARNNDTPYMTGCQTIPEFHAADSLGAGSFSGGTLNVHHAWALVDTAFSEDLGDTFYGVVADYGWGNSTWSWARNRIEERGGTVADASRHPLGNQDYASILNSISDSEAEVVFVANAGADTAQFLQQADEFGLLGEVEIIQPTNALRWTQIPPQETWEGVYTGFQWYPIGEDDQVTSWAEKMDEEYGYYGDTYAAITYNATRELARGANEEGSLSPDDIGPNLEQYSGFSYVKSYNENWRGCDNQLVTEMYVMQGTSPDQMGERGPWDLFEHVESYAGTDYLPECSHFENL